MRRRLAGDGHGRGPAAHGADTDDQHERAAGQQHDDDDLLDHRDHEYLVVERGGALDVRIIGNRIIVVRLVEWDQRLLQRHLRRNLERYRWRRWRRWRHRRRWRDA